MSPRPLVLLVTTLVLLVGCERPLIDEAPPALAVVGPDLDEVQLSSRVTLSVSARSLRGVDRVRIGGVDANFQPNEEVWEADVFLSLGTNTILLEASATDGTTTRDTAYAVFAPLSVSSPPANILPAPRAGHSATRLPTGGVFIAGGESTGGSVLQTGAVLIETDVGFSVDDPVTLQRQRTGHTASTLLDGRILLLGGTSTPTPTPTSFVDTPEVYDPATQTTRAVVVRGTPVRRTHHVAAFLNLNDKQYVYISGGQTPSGSSVFTPETTIIAEFRPGPTADTLVTLTPPTEASNGAALPDPTQIVVGSRIREVTTVVTGIGGSDSAARRVLYSSPGQFYPFAINPSAIPAPSIPRTSADGSPLAGGLALLVGGVSPSGETLPSIEAYSDAARRWVRFPASVSLGTPRRDHAVTLAPSGRILAIGGRGPSGQILATLDVLSF